MRISRPDVTRGEDETIHDEVVLHRAVDLDEAADIEEHGVRLGLNAMPCKWFAVRLEDAERWGQTLARRFRPDDPTPFRIASVRLPAAFLAGLHFDPSLDRVGPAYCVPEDRFDELNAIGVTSVSARLYYPRQ